MPKKLKKHNIKPKGKVHRNLDVDSLINKALKKKEGALSKRGSLTVKTGKYTGRSPNDRFIVKDQTTRDKVNWNKANIPISEKVFDKLYQQVTQHLSEQDELYIFDGMAGADPEHALRVRIVNEFAWQNLFVRHMLRRPTPAELATHEPDFTLLVAPNVRAIPAKDKTNSEAFIILNWQKGIGIIGGSHYAGEIKKAIFTTLNFMLPLKDILPMHCSANIGTNSDTALFFGLSGTGKTTLSADPDRRLIGDDEHAWADSGIFNVEGGCYAKCINLSREKEPQIYDAIRYGAICENVVMDPETGEYDFNDSRYTQNTRVCYPLDYIPDSIPEGRGSHPRTIIFLTADAYGVLPPIAKLDTQQAMYHFLSGYTSKLAGTERGITEPRAVFSTLYGEPFMPLDPVIYAKLLKEYINKYNPKIFLVNTGWTGGPYGIGHRINLPYTRRMVSAALDGELDELSLREDPIFKLKVPTQIKDIPDNVLNPVKTWKDKSAFEKKAKKLLDLFEKNFSRFSLST